MPVAGAIEENAVNGLVSRLAELTGVGTVASGATITLPLARTITVTGTTTITSITAGRDGRHVTLLIDGALQITDGSNLELAGNFVGDGAGGTDVLELVAQGANWVERGRSIN